MNLFDLYAKISLDTSEYDKGVDGAKKKSTSLSGALKKAGEVSETLKNKIAVLGSQFTSAQKEVDRLTSAFNKSVKETGIDSKETQKLAEELSSAEEKAAGFKNEIDRLSGELDESSVKTSNFGEKLKTGFSTALKVGAVALGAATTAVGVLTKASLEGYGSYEQLVGGVKTLFGTEAESVEEYAASVGRSVSEVQGEYDSLVRSQNTVMDNAANAFRTAGLSANQYMETVTSFSASLLQSLGGDTEAAAEYADMAITDMSDNANKMGTAMEMIQNAYGGFAKQNFTMLDNLKLGYGGTKEEMERLLADAEKISGIKYDISSYADMVDAIHVVQTEMGITGTTAKEAATTIQGSVAAAKSAWSNLVAGLGDENADLDQLVGNLVTSAETAAGNILPRITKILTGMGTAIEQLAPVIATEVPNLVTSVLPSLVSGGAQLLTGLITGLISAIPGLVSAVPEIVTAIATAVSDNLPTILAAGEELLDMLTTGILDGIPVMIEKLPKVIDGILNFITKNLPSVLKKGGDLLDKLAFGIIDAIPQMVSKLPEIINSFTKFITDNGPKILKSGGELLGKLIAGILGAIPQIAVQLPSVISAVVNAFRAGFTLVKDAGKYLLEGLWAGISDKVEWLKGKVSGVVDKIKGWFTGPKGFDEHSPSKWANQVFRYIMEGGGKGLEAGLNGLMGDVSNVVNKVKEGMDFSSVVPAPTTPDTDYPRPKQAAALPFPGITININGIQFSTVKELAQAVGDEVQSAVERSANIYGTPAPA